MIVSGHSFDPHHKYLKEIIIDHRRAGESKIVGRSLADQKCLSLPTVEWGELWMTSLSRFRQQS